MAKRNRTSLRGEDRRRQRAGAHTDKGKRFEGSEETKRNRATEVKLTLMMEFRASVTGLTRDST